MIPFISFKIDVLMFQYIKPFLCFNIDLQVMKYIIINYEKKFQNTRKIDNNKKHNSLNKEKKKEYHNKNKEYKRIL